MVAKKIAEPNCPRNIKIKASQGLIGKELVSAAWIIKSTQPLPALEAVKGIGHGQWSKTLIHAQ